MPGQPTGPISRAAWWPVAGCAALAVVIGVVALAVG